MNLPLLIDGVRCETEQAVRDYAFNYTKEGFKQDFRLASQANKLPFIQLIELLDSTGHTVQEAGI
jgi:hypothetical protein